MSERTDKPAAIIVVGGINQDIVFSGLKSFPTAGQTVAAREYEISGGGKGANQAVAAARLGGDVHLVGTVGQDAWGNEAIADLEAADVATELVQRCQRPTGIASVLVHEDAESVVTVAPGANMDGAEPDVEAKIAVLGDRPAVVLASLEVPLRVIHAWARAAASRSWPFILNPAPAQPLPAELYRLVGILTPNGTEMAALAGRPEDLLSAGVEAVVVTGGRRGADLHRQGTRPWHQPAYPCAAIDSSGAGDAFNAALAIGIAERWSPADAVRLAAAAGSLATRAVGARQSLPTRRELESLVPQRASTNRRPIESTPAH